MTRRSDENFTTLRNALLVLDTKVSALENQHRETSREISELKKANKALVAVIRDIQVTSQADNIIPEYYGEEASKFRQTRGEREQKGWQSTKDYHASLMRHDSRGHNVRQSGDGTYRTIFEDTGEEDDSDAHLRIIDTRLQRLMQQS